MSPAWMRPFPRHLGRVRSIQIAVAGYPCLDECHEGTAAGIYAIRRLKFKRCGELALRLSSRLTFAWGCVAVRAIHSSRCISAGLLVNFIEVRIFSVVVHANLTVETPATDTCGHGTACRSTHFGGTGQPGYRHRYL